MLLFKSDLTRPFVDASELSDSPPLRRVPVHKLGEYSLAILKPVTSIDAVELEFSLECRTFGCNAYAVVWVSVQSSEAGCGPFFGKGINCSAVSGAGWKRLRTVFRVRPGETVTEIRLAIMCGPPTDGVSCAAAARRVDVREIELWGQPLKLAPSQTRVCNWADLTPPIAVLNINADVVNDAEAAQLEREFVHVDVK